MWTSLNLVQELRKHVWGVHLVFISLFTYLGARIATVAVEPTMGPVADTEPLRIVPRVAPGHIASPLQCEQLAKLLGLPVPETEAEKQNAWLAGKVGAEPVRTTLRVRLLGTLLAVDSQWSLASILDLGTNRAETYWIGDKLAGAEILQIERYRTIILNNHRREYIDGDVAAAATGEEVPRPGSGIRALSGTEYEVSRVEVDRILANFTEVATQARAVPVYKDGQVQGFKLLWVRPDSIYSKLGVQNGDVIQRINGYEVSSVERVLELYTRLKDANRIEIEYERNGFKGSRTYNIR